jgi:transaldolase
LKRLGQAVWLDSIRRGQIVSGELKKLIEEGGLTGETANPTIFEKAIGESADYDEAIHRMRDKTPLEIYEALAVEDVRMAADVFRPVYEQTRGADGFVSLEVSPKLAYDTQGSIAEAQRFFKALDRPNVMIKIPGTKEGVPAIEECLCRGVNINITLLFSIHAYEQVAWAYIRALERRAAEGKPIDRIASVASFFVSRIDTLADKLIDDELRGTAEPARRGQLTALRGQVAIANAKLAYQSFLKISGDPRYLALKQKGARPQRPLWASTSTKDPRYSDVLYVEALIGPDTVDTLPLETIDDYRDHGRPRLTIQEGLDRAKETLQSLPEVGLSLDAITQQVLEEGVEKFDVSLEKLLRGIEAKRVATVARAGAK